MTVLTKLHSDSHFEIRGKRERTSTHSFNSILIPSSSLDIFSWQESQSVTVRVSQKKLVLLEKMYLFRIKDDVIWFLEEHPFIVSTLFDAYFNIEEFFPLSKMMLEVVSDREVSDSHQLVIRIMTSLNAEGAFDKLTQLDEQWWLKANRKTDGMLGITLEFK
ncbi:MAG: hypothetical protein E2O76_03250 [Caldithrix sp.]|nr:MAG: hypothetical protein E2O76_03250 [Caldithrix sp.]